MGKSRNGKWLVYILRCQDGSLYTGITNDLSKRLRAHRERKGSKYVASRLPFRVALTEHAGSKSAALRREIQIKRMDKSTKEAILDSK